MAVREGTASAHGSSRSDPSTRGYAVAAGVLFIIATAASLGSQPFLAPASGPDFLANVAAHQGQVSTGALLTIIAGLASTGIALSLYPVLRRYSEGLAIGAVGFRIIEGVTSVVSAVALLSVISLSQDYAAAGQPEQASYKAAGAALLAENGWLGNVGLVSAFSVGGLLYYLAFYRSRLIPRWLSVWGIVGVALLMVVVGLLLFGAIGPLSVVQLVLALPIAVQEMVLAVWLIGKGFATTP
jgi:Domain of unknown function (DUF4386)